MKVSVGISFYNAADYLGYSIQSVLNQTYSNFELLLIDDGSLDDSLLIARSFNDSRIRLFSDGINKGLAKRLNELVALSDGEYFVRMDADDIMFPNRLELQIKYLSDHPDVDVVGSAACSIDCDNHIIGMLNVNPHPKSIMDVFNHRCFVHPTIIALRSWFLNNPYDERSLRMEDFNLWIRTINTSNFRNLDIPLIYYRSVGMPYLFKYLRSMGGERRELLNLSIGLNEHIYILIKIYLKCVVYIIFSMLGLRDFLLKKRSDVIHSQSDYQKISETLNKIILCHDKKNN